MRVATSGMALRPCCVRISCQGSGPSPDRCRRIVFDQGSTNHVSSLMDGLAGAHGGGDAGLEVDPARMDPGGLDQLRWALGCDEIENLDRLLSQAEAERIDQGYYNQLLDTGLGARPGTPDQPDGRRTA